MRTTAGMIQEYKALFDEGFLSSDEYNFLKENLLKQGDKEFEEVDDVMETTKQKMIAEKKDDRKKSVSEFFGSMGKIAVVILLLIICIVLLKGCVGIFLDAGSDLPDYETYYQDDNGNGTLDQGEWNYTVDENGNTVDIDNDLSNFE